MLRQQVFAPVAVEVTPHAVNVIGVVLRVIVLDQKRAALHAVVVAFAFLQAAHPGEFDLVEARLADFVQPLACLRLWLRAKILLDQGQQLPCWSWLSLLYATPLSSLIVKS